MRLLHTSTLSLTEFLPGNIPKYAILSHRWGSPEDEILFHDIGQEHASSKAAYGKVLNACHHAKSDGYEYIWIDTCSIDKSSSAELSEAINSMFQFYAESEVCYAFLSDINIDSLPKHATAESEPDETLWQSTEFQKAFSSSSWFTRGWTLQELIAPKNVRFFDSKWKCLGTKVELVNLIFSITGIGVGYLLGWLPIATASIAHRMSWVATRITTRTEDIAYCMLGIFSVNMPLLYGEGIQAFLRLQEELLKSSSDHSLFAWHSEETFSKASPLGLLALDPRYFLNSGSIFPCVTSDEPYTLMNRGIRLDLRVQEDFGFGDDIIFHAALNCADRKRAHNGGNNFVVIKLARLRIDSDEFVRKDPKIVFGMSSSQFPKTRTIFIRTQIVPDNIDNFYLTYPYNLKLLARLSLPNNDDNFRIIEVSTLNLGTNNMGLLGRICFPISNAKEGRIPRTLGIAINWLPSVATTAIVAHCRYGEDWEAILITIGSNCYSEYRIRSGRSLTATKDLEHMAFDAQKWVPRIDRTPIEIATYQYKPHTAGMELFLDHFAVTVRSHANLQLQFDPTIIDLELCVRPLFDDSKRPARRLKWEKNGAPFEVGT
jgi:hypothetical protein